MGAILVGAVSVPLPQTFSHHPAIPPPVRVPLTTLSEHSCAYLPGRCSTSRAFCADALPARLYQRFMDAGFRRSGRIVYQPVCAGCRACVPIRVPVESFRASKSQRRCARRNADLSVSVGPPFADDEAYDLYARYATEWHGSASPPTPDELQQFLYDSPVDTLEFKYREPTAGGRLLAVGICDVGPGWLSSVYFFHDPAARRRGLGTFGVLYEIAWARAQRDRIDHYYLGYWIAGCASMEYKSQFRPYELLCGDGKWRAGGLA